MDVDLFVNDKSMWYENIHAAPDEIRNMGNFHDTALR